MPGKEEWEQLRAIADGGEIRLTKEFLKLIQVIATAELERRLLAALQRRQIQRAIAIVQQAFEASTALYQPALANELLTIEQKSYAVAANTLDLGKIIGSFDLTNPEAVEFARTRGSQFVAQLTADTQQLLRTTISSSFIEGIPPRETAQLIRQSIGLTANQAAAMRNYRGFLEGLARRGALDDLPPSVLERVRRSDIRLLPKTTALSEARIDRMVEKYRDRLMKERALTLVRTETMAASNNGQQVLWNQALDRGLLNEAKTRRKWIVTPDDKLCPRCRPMAGQLRKLDEPFQSPYDGTIAMTPPLHWNCRCAMGIVQVRKATL